MFAFTQLCPQLILEMFNAEPAVIDYGVTYLRAFCFDYLIVPFVFCINGLMLGAGHSMFSLVNNSFRRYFCACGCVLCVQDLAGSCPGVGRGGPGGLACVADRGRVVPSQRALEEKQHRHTSQGRSGSLINIRQK